MTIMQYRKVPKNGDQLSALGFGAMRRLSAVRWGVAGNIVWAWVLTIPVAGCIGALTYAAVSALAAVL